jgi:hypothetical protein
MPGACFKAVFRDSKTVGLIVDGTTNNGCPVSSIPVVEFCVDDGPLKTVPLARTTEIYSLPLGNHLEMNSQHWLDVCFRAADLTQNRWRASTSHLRIAGLVLDRGGSLLPCPRRPKRAIGFGDSIPLPVSVPKDTQIAVPVARIRVPGRVVPRRGSPGLPPAALSACGRR